MKRAHNKMKILDAVALGHIPATTAKVRALLYAGDGLEWRKMAGRAGFEPATF